MNGKSIGLTPKMIPLKIEGLEIANPVTCILFVDSPSGFTCIFILDENIHASRVVTLSAEGLGTMSENNLRGIVWGIRLTLLPFILSWSYHREDTLSQLDSF